MIQKLLFVYCYKAVAFCESWKSKTSMLNHRVLHGANAKEVFAELGVSHVDWVIHCLLMTSWPVD